MAERSVVLLCWNPGAERWLQDAFLLLCAAQDPTGFRAGTALQAAQVLCLYSAFPSGIEHCQSAGTDWHWCHAARAGAWRGQKKEKYN